MLIQFSCFFGAERHSNVSLPPWKCQYGFNQRPFPPRSLAGHNNNRRVLIWQSRLVRAGRVSTNWIDTDEHAAPLFTDSCLLNRLLSVGGQQLDGAGHHAESVTTSSTKTDWPIRVDKVFKLWRPLVEWRPLRDPAKNNWIAVWGSSASESKFSRQARQAREGLVWRHCF